MASQPSANWILHQIFDRILDALVGPKDMVERFVLPNSTPPSQDLIHKVGGFTLNALHYLWNATWAELVRKSREHQVHVIRHNDYPV